MAALFASDAFGNSRSEYVTCDSGFYEYNTCELGVDLRNAYVRVDRQLSRVTCYRGENWGVNRFGIWVEGGCSAVFEIRYRRPRPPSDRREYTTCGSRDFDYNECYIGRIERRSIRLENNLSRVRCVRGENWGYDGGGYLWVDYGCRATFSYVPRRPINPW